MWYFEETLTHPSMGWLNDSSLSLSREFGRVSSKQLSVSEMKFKNTMPLISYSQWI